MPKRPDFLQATVNVIYSTATPEAVKMEQQQLEVTTTDQIDNSDNKSNSSKISESK